MRRKQKIKDEFYKKRKENQRKYKRKDNNVKGNEASYLTLIRK